jgi:SsrA-binding protein
MAAANKDPKRFTEIRNSKALRDYFVDERFEAGLQLRGTEVKSIRAGKAQISDAFGRIEKGEAWLHNAHIEQYAFGNIHNHDAKRIRKLLLHAATSTRSRPRSRRTPVARSCRCGCISRTHS